MGYNDIEDDSMRCNKCSSEIYEKANFCPYCGNKLYNEQDNQFNNYDDPFKDIRIDTNQGQFEYQKHYSNSDGDDFDKLAIMNKNDNSLIGLMLGIGAIFISIYNCWIGFAFAVIAVAFTICGVRHTKRSFGIMSLIISIILLLISIIISVGSIKITYTNGYETTIKNDFINTFLSGVYEDNVYGYWLDEDDELFYLDEEGNYYIYYSCDELTDNYYYGKYSLDDGLTLSDDEILYGDDSYYYYHVNTSLNKVKKNGVIFDDTVELIKNGFTLKLDKNNRKRMVIVFDDISDKEIELLKK